MASLKVKFRASSSEANEGVLFYQIIHKRVVRHVAVHYKLYANEWNAKKETVVIDHCDKDREEYLNSINYKIVCDKRRFEYINRKLVAQCAVCTVDEVVEKFRKHTRNSSLFKFMERLIDTYKAQGQVRTGETYASTLNSIKRFRNNVDVELLDIDCDFVVSYKHYLSDKGVQHNTISFYMHRLRAVYNKAAEQELIEQKYPFRHLRIGIERTVKRAITVRYIKKIKSLNIKELSSMDFARDMFLFSFYTRGMSFVDIAYLRKKDLKSGFLVYRRKKTGQKLVIKWEPCMQQILNKYKADATSLYLFPIINENNGDVRKQYYNTQALINNNLKKLGKEVGLDIPLTMYVARHSWASIARNEGVPIAIISEGMGHESEKTTQVYLASIDNKVIDNANRKIIKLI